MMKTILDIVDRTPKPAPWSEGDNIPWDNPEFSERMLAEHLSQEHHEEHHGCHPSQSLNLHGCHMGAMFMMGATDHNLTMQV